MTASGRKSSVRVPTWTTFEHLLWVEVAVRLPDGDDHIPTLGLKSLHPAHSIACRIAREIC
jgi:hypothetical protein